MHFLFVALKLVLVLCLFGCYGLEVEQYQGLVRNPGNSVGESWAVNLRVAELGYGNGKFVLRMLKRMTKVCEGGLRNPCLTVQQNRIKKRMILKRF